MRRRRGRALDFYGADPGSNPRRFILQSLSDPEAALCQARGRGPGPDGITTKMLQEQRPVGKTALLRIANKSPKNRKVPTIWKRATIIVIRTPGKSRANPKSYRSISLTSCVGNIVKIMIQGRIQHLLETTQVFAPEQAGFKDGRSTEEQITRLS